jgi:hypothetical protein
MQASWGNIFIFAALTNPMNIKMNFYEFQLFLGDAILGGDEETSNEFQRISMNNKDV